MKTLGFVSVIAIFVAVLTHGASARVIGGDLDNGVAVYLFSSLTDENAVRDYSGNGLHGVLANRQRREVYIHTDLILSDTRHLTPLPLPTTHLC